MNWSINYTAKAENDLRGIYEYIAYNLFIPMTAKKQINSIMDEISKLDTNPHIFPLYKKEPWRSKGIRFVTVNNYVIFYLPNDVEHTVTIIRILYGGSDIETRLND